MLTNILLTSVIILAIVIIVLILRSRDKGPSDEELSRMLETQLHQSMAEFLKTSNENLVNLAKDKLGAEKQEIKTDMQNKKEAIQKLVDDISKTLSENQKKLEESDRDRIGSFRALEKSLTEYKEITGQLATTTEGLKKVLSNNQLRGQFGEQVAEDLLKMAGFVRGTDYEFNKQQTNTSTRPDFAIFLPDGTKINVDSKFPFAALQKMAETDDNAEKATHMKQFERDVKEKIKQVTSRDYINPESADKTVDFVILFIPNEMIFSFIYEKMPEIWQDAMSQKIVLAGPFSFTAILRMVRQAYDNFKYQSNIHEIIDHIHTFEGEFAKFIEEFEKVGDRIQSLDKQFQKVSTTRANQLVRRMDQVKLSDPDKSIGKDESLGLLEDVA